MVCKPIVGQMQNFQAVVIQRSEIHLVFPVAPGDVLNLAAFQQTFFHQGVQVDQVVVACIGGAGLVRRVAVAGGIQRQNLPDALAGLLHKIYKMIGFLAHGANTVRAGQGSDMHQNATFTHKKYLHFP